MFVPQYVMFGGPHWFHDKPQLIDDAIQTFLVEHGFNGFHVPVMCRWFDIEHSTADRIRSKKPMPDPRTFEALDPAPAAYPRHLQALVRRKRCGRRLLPSSRCEHLAA